MRLISAGSISLDSTFKYVNSYFIKNDPKTLISGHNMQPNTLTRREYKGKIYYKNIRKNSWRILNGSRTRVRNQL
jgi:hypothetical protein